MAKDRAKIGGRPIKRQRLGARLCPQGQPQRVENSEASGLNCELRLVCDTAALRFICRKRRCDESQIKEKLETPHVVSYEMERRKSFSNQAKARAKAAGFAELTV